MGVQLHNACKSHQVLETPFCWLIFDSTFWFCEVSHVFGQGVHVCLESSQKGALPWFHRSEGLCDVNNTKVPSSLRSTTTDNLVRGDDERCLSQDGVALAKGLCCDKTPATLTATTFIFFRPRIIRAHIGTHTFCYEKIPHALNRVAKGLQPFRVRFVFQTSLYCVSCIV